MKTFVIIASVLAITTVAYGINTERLHKYFNNFAKCSEDLGESPSEPTAKALICTLEKDGQIFNANNEFMKDASIDGLGDVISNPHDLKEARKIFDKCYDDAIQNGLLGKEQRLKIATCCLPIIPFLDKV